VPTAELLTLIVLGLFAGVLGGLLGIGGSIVMIPVLTLVLHRDQHFSQASAMIVNFFVSAPAIVRHQRARAVRWDVVGRMLPAAVICIVLGVQVSEPLDARSLERVFGVFLIYVIFVNARKLLDRRPILDEHANGRGWVGPSIVGAITGFAAGVLGIGGGIIAVPLLQRVTHLRLRTCIACSAAAMCVTSVFGAIRKNWLLDTHFDAAGLALDPWESVRIAGCLAPTAIIGAYCGATLTHTLPLKWVRGVLIVLLCVAAFKFLS
jgi:uncharacterized membrane protein YfcA